MGQRFEPRKNLFGEKAFALAGREAAFMSPRGGAVVGVVGAGFSGRRESGGAGSGITCRRR